MTSAQIWREIFSLIISQFDDRKTKKKTDSGVGLEKRKNNLRKLYANYFQCPPSAQRLSKPAAATLREYATNKLVAKGAPLRLPLCDHLLVTILFRQLYKSWHSTVYLCPTT